MDQLSSYNRHMIGSWGYSLGFQENTNNLWEVHMNAHAHANKPHDLSACPHGVRWGGKKEFCFLFLLSCPTLLYFPCHVTIFAPCPPPLPKFPPPYPFFALIFHISFMFFWWHDVCFGNKSLACDYYSLKIVYVFSAKTVGNGLTTTTTTVSFIVYRFHHVQDLYTSLDLLRPIIEHPCRSFYLS